MSGGSYNPVNATRAVATRTIPLYPGPHAFAPVATVATMTANGEVGCDWVSFAAAEDAR